MGGRDHNAGLKPSRFFRLADSNLKVVVISGSRIFETEAGWFRLAKSPGLKSFQFFRLVDSAIKVGFRA